MSIIQRMRRQKAVWWEETGEDNTGLPTYGSPVQIDCRWEDITEEFMGVDGDQEVSNAKVYVDRVMKPGDALWRGLLADAPATPGGAAGVYLIRRFDEIPNLRATEYLKIAWL